MNEKRNNNTSSHGSGADRDAGTPRQADIKEVRPLDLEAAREAVKNVVEEELRSEIVSADVLNFRMKCC